MRGRRSRLVPYLLVLLCGIIEIRCQAQTQPEASALTLEQVITRARLKAPLLLSARARILEAQGRLRGASILLQVNPMIEGTVGPRFSNQGRFTATDVSVSQNFEPFGRRSARIAGAEAAVTREIAASLETEREVLRAVATSFAKAQGAQEKLKLLTTAQQVASGLLGTAERRYQVGDIPILDVNLAKNAAARTYAELCSGSAELVGALGELRVLVGIPAEEGFSVTSGPMSFERYDLNFLISAGEEQPNIRILESERMQALSEVRLGDTFKSPEFGVIARYQRDQGDNITQGGIRVGIPLFSRGQELTATGDARASRIAAEISALKIALRNQIKSAFEAYTYRTEAAEQLRTLALPSLEENETLARRSYEEGEIALPELLLIRREMLDTRLAYINTLLDANLAGIELRFIAGILK